ncbi:MAG: LysR family transcriptional regulator [Peptococcaceae bacterium]
MKLEYLSYIVAIHQGGSLSKAAELLHTSPQNVSRVLQLLENETQLSLFKRTSQGIVLTNAGEDALIFATSTLHDYRELLAKHQTTLPNQIKGTLDIATFPAAGIPFLNNLILKFNRSYPNITVNILEMDLEASFQYFLEHDDVIAALPLQDLPNSSNYNDQVECIPMVTSKLAVIANKHSDLAKKPSISLKQLCKEPLIFISKNSYKKSATYIILSMHHLESNLLYKPFATPNVEQYYQAIIQNGYASLIDELTFSRINPLYQKQLATIPLRDACAEIHYSIAIHKKNHLSEAGKLFYQFCQTYGH